MKSFYVSAQIAQLDLGATVLAENQHMASIAFKDTYEYSLRFSDHKLRILGVEEVN